MSLRVLLGYDPKEAKHRQDFGGMFQTFVPPRATNMASQRFRPKVPVASVKRLPPIDEEGLSAQSTPRNKNVHFKRLPKNTFYGLSDNGDDLQSVLKPRPVVQVQPMPRKPPSPDFEKFEPKKDYSVKQLPVNTLTPLDVNHSLVDGLVADYLHYSRYGHVIPVYEGSSPAACPCCTQRNRQNVRTLLGFSKDIKEPPKKYDKKSHIEPFKVDATIPPDAAMYPNSLYAYQTRPAPEPTEEEKRRRSMAEQSQRYSWMNYQPLPYARNFLNPEFNRPSQVESFYDTDALYGQQTMVNSLMEANSNYDSAMNRLESFTSRDSKY